MNGSNEKPIDFVTIKISDLSKQQIKLKPPQTDKMIRLSN